MNVEEYNDAYSINEDEVLKAIDLVRSTAKAVFDGAYCTEELYSKLDSLGATLIDIIGDDDYEIVPDGYYAGRDADGNEGLFEDFEQSIGE